jgi:hypothetical protein
MAIKAAEYEVGFNSQTAISAFDAFKNAVKAGNADMDTAARQLIDAFEQQNTVRRKSAKEVDHLTRFIKEERKEQRELGFMVRNTAQSVGGLAEVFGARGLEGVLLSSFARYDQVKFALEGIEVAGKGAGGRLGQIAGLLGGIAVPAGIAFTAFAAIKGKLKEDEEAVKRLTKEVRALNIELRNVKATPLLDLTKELEKLNRTGPPVDVWTVLLPVLDSILNTEMSVNKETAATLEHDKKRLTVQKQIRDAIKEQLQNAEGLKRLADEYKLVQATHAEKASQLAIIEATLTEGERKRVSSMLAHKALLDDQIVWAQGNLAVGKQQHMTLLDQIIAQTEINRLIAERKRLNADIANQQAEDAVYFGEFRRDAIAPVALNMYLPEFSRAHQESREFLRTLKEIERIKKAAEHRNVPKHLLPVETVTPIRGAAEDPVVEEFRQQMIGVGNDLSSAISQGFMSGFDTGHLELKSFTDAVLNSIKRIIAQQAGIAAIAGIVSLLSGTSFLGWFQTLGGFKFSGEGGSSSGGRPVSPDDSTTSMKSDVHAIALAMKKSKKSGATQDSIIALKKEEIAVVVRQGDRILQRRRK